MFNTETIEINSFIPVTKLSNSMCATSAYSSRFIKYTSSFIFLGKLFLEKTPLNLGSF